MQFSTVTKFTLALLLIMCFIACQKKYKSKLFEDCYCDETSFSQQVMVQDIFENYAITAPDSTWSVETSEGDSGPYVTLVKLDGDQVLALSISQLKKINPWPSKEEALEEIRSENNVLQEGDLIVDSLEGYWSVLLHEDSTVSLNVTLEQPESNTFFSISLFNSTALSRDYRKAFCQLEPLLFSFKRNELWDDFQLNFTKKYIRTDHELGG